jgi:hypothetical protein
MTARQDGIDTRLPGIALLTSSVIALAAMAQHPTTGSVHSDSTCNSPAIWGAVSACRGTAGLAPALRIHWGVAVDILYRPLASLTKNELRVMNLPRWSPPIQFDCARWFGATGRNNDLDDESSFHLDMQSASLATKG